MDIPIDMEIPPFKMKFEVLWLLIEVPHGQGGDVFMTVFLYERKKICMLETFGLEPKRGP